MQQPQFTVRASAIINDTSISVTTTWDGPGLDRKTGLAWGLADRSFKKYSAALWAKRVKQAHRLVEAVNAGAVFTRATLQRDVHGRTYVQADCHVFGKQLEADLNRLGF